MTDSCDLCHGPDAGPLSEYNDEWLCADCRRHSEEWDAMTPEERRYYIESGDRYVQEVEDERRRYEVKQ